jgi:hypothetical protein
MHNKFGMFVVAALAATSLYGQDQDEGHWPVTLGLKAGIPVTQMFSTGTPAFSGNTYTSSAPRYEFGASAEFHLPFHLRFEVDGLYKRGGFDNSFTSLAGVPGYMRTSFSQWEIPGLFKYNFSVAHLRPFVDVGASFRHISTIDQRSFLNGGAPISVDNSAFMANRNSFGGVAGFGITFKKGPFELTPEARYTRWANSSFAVDGLKSSKDQGDVLLGISF